MWSSSAFTSSSVIFRVNSLHTTCSSVILAYSITYRLHACWSLAAVVSISIGGHQGWLGIELGSQHSVRSWEGMEKRGRIRTDL